MAQYNGHRSWNAWNVSLWINNDEGLYRWAYDLASKHGIGKAACIMARDLIGERTPDGGRYNQTAIREALRGII
jgi:hypothetical protein